MKRKIIEKEKLEELYINQNLSIPQVSKELNVSGPVISYWIKEYNIVKDKSAIYANHKLKLEIPKERIIDLYITQNNNIAQTSSMLGITDGTLNTYLVHYNITKPAELIERRRAALVSETAKTRDPKIKEDRNRKYKETCKERYGVDNGSKSQQARDKISTKVKASSEEAKDKRIQTNLYKYGTQYATQSSIVKYKTCATNNIRYGGNSPYCNDKIKLKMRATCLERYGVEHQNQRHLPKESIEITNNTELFEHYINSLEDKSYESVASSLGYSIHAIEQKVRQHNLKHLMPIVVSKYEYEIKEWLISKGITTNRTRAIISPYEIDLYSEEYKIGIEFNGSYWHSTLNIEDKEKHQKKSLLAEEKGLFIYHIFEYDWLNPIKQEIIKSQLLNLFGKTPNKIYARKCEIREVPYKDAKVFIDNNHLQGDGNLNKQVNYGLYYENELVYIMTFGKWRRGFKGLIEYEIFRSCSKLYTTVVGGAEKLFKHFRQNYPNKTIGTYSSIQSGTGKLYERLGFRLKHITKPTSIKTDGLNVYTMFSKGYNQEDLFEIYNCGNKLWILN